MGAPLTKTRAVLVHVDTLARAVVFAGVEDVIDVDEGATALYLATNVWLDMGSPRTITVTVRPGDRLNP